MSGRAGLGGGCLNDFFRGSSGLFSKGLLGGGG